MISGGEPRAGARGLVPQGLGGLEAMTARMVVAVVVVDVIAVVVAVAVAIFSIALISRLQWSLVLPLP